MRTPIALFLLFLLSTSALADKVTLNNTEITDFGKWLSLQFNCTSIAGGIYATARKQGAANGYKPGVGKRAICTSVSGSSETSAGVNILYLGAGDTDVGMASATQPTNLDARRVGVFQGTSSGVSEIFAKSIFIILESGEFLGAHCGVSTGSFWASVSCFETP